MAPGPFNQVLRQLRRLVGGPSTATTTDAELLQRFVRERDESAFADLMDRHGPMVLGVCRRMLGDAHAAEDAFQAAFLVLIRKAHTIGNREAIGPWLYRVAFRLALRARGSFDRTRFQPLEVETMDTHQPASEPGIRELRPILDEEVHRLPEKYRAPIVLCYFEGRTNQEAAELLRWPIGTVMGRLSRARDLLRGRLARRGLALSSASLAALFSPADALAALPAALRQITLQSAVAFVTDPAVATRGLSAPVAALLDGALRDMMRTKFRLAFVVVLSLGTLGLAAGWTMQRVTKARPQPNEVAANVAVAIETPTDPHGDPLPRRALARLGTARLFGNTGVTFAPDGKVLAYNGDQGNSSSIILADVRSGKPVERIENLPFGAYSVAFSPDGKTLAWCGNERQVRFWDRAARKELEPLPIEQNYAYRLAFSPRGDALALALADNKGIDVIDLQTRKRRCRVGGRAETFQMQFSPDGTALLAAVGNHLIKEDGQPGIRAWDALSGQELCRIPADTRAGFAVTPDGQSVIVLTDTYVVRVYDLAGKARRDVTFDGGNFLFFAPDAKSFATVRATTTSVQTITMWSLDSGKVLRSFAIDDVATLERRPAFSCTLSTDGRLVAMQRWGRIQIWDANAGQEVCPLASHRGSVLSVAISDDEKTVTSLDGDYHVHRWDLRSGKELEAPAQSRGPVAISHDGKLLASEGATYGQVSIRPAVGEGKERLFGKLEEGDLKQILFSPGGKHLATMTVSGAKGLREGTIQVWSVADGKELAKFKAERLDAISEDGSKVGGAIRTWVPTSPGAVASDVPVVWDVATGQELRRWPAEFGRIGAFHGNKSVVAWTGEGVRLLDVETGAERLHLKAPDDAGFIMAAALSPDGGSLAYSSGADYSVVIWDVASNKAVRHLHGHQGHVTTLTFSSDGNRLISGSTDTTALVWDLR